MIDYVSVGVQIWLRVPPEDVRELYHTWLLGLWAGELQREEPALPARHTDQDVRVRRVSQPLRAGGFDASGPVTVADIIARVGAGEYRVSAHGFDPRGWRWEVCVRLGGGAELDGDEAEEAEQIHARAGAKLSCALVIVPSASGTTSCLSKPKTAMAFGASR